MSITSSASRRGRALARLLLMVVLAGGLIFALAAPTAAATVSINGQVVCGGDPVLSTAWTNYDGASWNSWAEAIANPYYLDGGGNWVLANRVDRQTGYGSSGSAVADAPAPHYATSWQLVGQHYGSSDLFTRWVDTYHYCP